MASSLPANVKPLSLRPQMSASRYRLWPRSASTSNVRLRWRELREIHLEQMRRLASHALLRICYRLMSLSGNWRSSSLSSRSTTPKPSRCSRRSSDDHTADELARALVEPPPATLPATAVAFCKRYLPFELSPAWEAFIRGLYGLPLNGPMKQTLAAICGFEKPTRAGYSEGLVVAGRRSGKSAVAATLALYEAVARGPEHMARLAYGQKGFFVVLSKTQRQALECFRFARGACEKFPELNELLDEPPLESQSGGELRFKSGATLTVMPASKSSIRGYSVLFALLDEWSWQQSGAESADQDVEVHAAARYGMVAPRGAPQRRLIIISSPAARAGLVYQTYTDHFGEPSGPVLVARGATWTWNPSIDRDKLELERQRDPKIYEREVLAEFVDRVSAWIDGAVIDAAARDRNAAPLPPVPRVQYFGAVDVALKRDRTILAIGHIEMIPDDSQLRFVVDGLWSWRPTPGVPLDARATVADIADICHSYRVTEIRGDQFCAIPLKQEFLDYGIELYEMVATSQTKIEAFTRLREAFYAERVSLPADSVALEEFRSLQERVTSGGHIQISAPDRTGSHDDVCFAVAWLHASALMGGGLASAMARYTTPTQQRDAYPGDETENYSTWDARVEEILDREFLPDRTERIEVT